MLLTTQAALLSLNRSSLYYVPGAPAPEEMALKHRIDEPYTQGPCYEVQQIIAQLQREGRQVNQKAVARQMRERGRAALQPGPKLSKRAQQAAIYPYLLRQVAAAHPNQVGGLRSPTFVSQAAGCTWWRSWIGIRAMW
jgi:putative transposase